MPEQYLIYIILKDIISKYDDKIQVTYNDIDKTKENVIGIIVSGNQTSYKRELGTGKYYGRVAHVTFNMNCNKDRAGIIKGNILMEKIRDELVIISNKIYRLTVDMEELKASLSDDGDTFVNISQTELLSDVVYVGKSKMEIPQYSLNVVINYATYKQIKEE